MVHADKLSSDKLFVWETIYSPPSRTKKSRGNWQHMVLGHADHNRGQLYIPSPEEYCLSIVALSTIIGVCRTLLTFGYPVHSLQTLHHIPPTLRDSGNRGMCEETNSASRAQRTIFRLSAGRTRRGTSLKRFYGVSLQAQIPERET